MNFPTTSHGYQHLSFNSELLVIWGSGLIATEFNILTTNWRNVQKDSITFKGSQLGVFCP